MIIYIYARTLTKPFTCFTSLIHYCSLQAGFYLYTRDFYTLLLGIVFSFSLYFYTRFGDFLAVLELFKTFVLNIFTLGFPGTR